MSEKPITWQERVANLREALGREPTLDELVTTARAHQPLTPEEIQAHRECFGRHNISTGDPRFD